MAQHRRVLSCASRRSPTFMVVPSPWGKQMRHRIGLNGSFTPRCVGPTKTLAKFAKPPGQEERCFNGVRPPAMTGRERLWWMGRRSWRGMGKGPVSEKRLAGMGIDTTSPDLRNASPKKCEPSSGVVMERTCNELRDSARELEDAPPKQQIMSSRSLGRQLKPSRNCVSRWRRYLFSGQCRRKLVATELRSGCRLCLRADQPVQRGRAAVQRRDHCANGRCYGRHTGADLCRIEGLAAIFQTRISRLQEGRGDADLFSIAAPAKRSRCR